MQGTIGPFVERAVNRGGGPSFLRPSPPRILQIPLSQDPEPYSGIPQPPRAAQGCFQGCIGVFFRVLSGPLEDQETL